MRRESPIDRLKEKIKQSGLKQSHLAKKIGVSPQHLQSILARNNVGSKYLPKIAEALGLDKTWVEHGDITIIQVLDKADLIALADNSVSFERLKNVFFESYPLRTDDRYYFFGYRLQETVNSRILEKDLLICTSYLPLGAALTGKVGVAYLHENSTVFNGILKYDPTDSSLSIYSETTLHRLKTGDLLFGVALKLERALNQ